MELVMSLVWGRTLTSRGDTPTRIAHTRVHSSSSLRPGLFRKEDDHGTRAGCGLRSGLERDPPTEGTGSV